MENKFSKFINLQGKYLTSLLILLAFSIGQMWGTALADLNFSWPTTLPSAYIYSTANTPTIATVGSKSSVYVANGGGTTAPTISGTGITGGKRWMGFTPSVDCTVKIQVYSNKKIFDLYDETGVIASYTNTAQAWEEWTPSVTLKAGKYYAIGARNSQCYVGAMTFSAAAVTKHTVTYVLNGATGTTPTQADVAENAKFTLHDGTTGITPVSGKEFAGWNDGTTTYAGGAEYTMGTSNVTLTAQWQDPAPKYSVTYVLNGPSGDAPTQASVAAGTSITLADAPSWAGHAFDGWLCSADAAVKAAGASYTMTAANTTFTAQWHEVDCKIYSLTGGIGSAVVQQANATVNDGVSLILSNSDGIIKLSPASGSFNVGDIVTISGTVGNTTKEFGVKISSAADKKANLGTASVAGTTNPMVATATLSAASDYLYICRTGGTTQTILTCEVHRACAEGTAAGLGYAETEVNKTEGDAAFTNPLTNANSLVLDGYKSSNEEVATVNFSTGEVTIVGAGDATISANSAVQTKSGTLYAAGTASYALHVAAIPTYTVTYDLNGGTGTTPTEAAKAAGATFTLHNGATDITAPASQEFDGWLCDIDAVKYAASASYTMTAANTTFTAQWRAITDKFVVIYMDGAVEMGRENVIVGQHPTASAIDKTKPLYTFSNWKDALDEPINLADISAAKDAEITVYAVWNKVYASSVDLEGLVESSGTSADWQTYLSNNGYAFSTSNVSLDAKASGKTYENWPYQGLKAKAVGVYVEGNIHAGKLVIVKLGHMAAAANVSFDGTSAGTATGLDAAEPAGQLNYFYAENESKFRYETTNADACVLKAITIQDPFQVLFDENGGDPVAAQYGHPSVTLPSASNGTASLLGWFDDPTDGNKIGEPGDTYTPAANITLYAHWEDVSTDARISAITLNPSTGTWEPAFDPEVVNYTYTMPYGTAAVPQIESAVKNHPMASDPVVDVQASAWGETAQVHGVAQSGDTKNYYIQMLRAPKDGVEIIRATHSGATTATITGVIGGEADKNTQTGGKLGSNGHYFGIKLAEGTFQAGDLLKIHATTTSPLVQIFSDKGETAIDDAGAFNAGGDYFFTLSAATEWIYLYRTSTAGSSMNPVVEYMAVYRPMNPVLTAIQFNATKVDVSGTNVAVTLPYGTDLGEMAITPTIVWNGAGTAVAANEWEWDVANTYTVTDKDGDATVYTITLTEDVLKHTVSFNTHGGSAVASVEVEDGEKLAAAPADPTKEDYIFQGWAETEDGDIVDVTSFTISADKEFHAVWVSDGAIKLLDGATVNHTNFITGVTADNTVEFMGNTVNYAKFSGTVSGVNGVKDLTRVIAYNATTNKTKIRISAHNNSTSARTILVKGLVEGASAAEDLASIALGNKEDVISDWIEFDNAANRTIYIMVSSSAGDVYFTQVKVIESGETPMKQFGEIGYSLNLNKGRFFGTASTDLAFEGLNARLSGDYTALNSGYAKLNATSMSFTLAAPALLTVTTNNNKTYYVTKGAAGTDNETAKTGASEFNLTAGTWFITGGTEEVQITNIEFETPKSVTPVITAQPSSKVDFATSDNLTAEVTVETPSDGGTLSYQWYNAADNSEVTGATLATLTTTEPGTYYVIITNSQEGYQDALIQSDNATLKYRRADDASLIELTYGSEAIELVDGVYDYRVVLPEDATVVPTLSATATMSTYGATAEITDATAFEEYEAVSSVLVTAEDRATTQTYTVTFVVKHPYAAIENVTGNTVWDWRGNVNQVIDDVANKGTVIANYIDGDNFEKIEGQEGAYARRTQNDGVYQGNYLHFNTTVAGKVKFYFRAPSSGDVCTITVKNGSRTVVAGSRGNTLGWSDEVYVTGDVVVEIKNVSGKDGSLTQGRIQQIIFTAVTPDYTRDLTEGRYGTICLPNGGIMVGAEIFEIAYYGETTQKIFLDNVPSGEMVAGRPYIFYPNKGVSQLAVFYTDEDNADAGKHNGLNGFIGASAEDYYYIPDGEGNYILQNNLYREVQAGAQARILSNRAFIKLSEISPTEPALAPGRRRISMGVQSEQVATGIGNVQGDEVQSTKVLINGQLFILRGEKMYDATGRLVK